MLLQVGIRTQKAYSLCSKIYILLPNIQVETAVQTQGASLYKAPVNSIMEFY